MNTGCGCQDCKNYEPRTDRLKDVVGFLVNTKVPDNSLVSIDGNELVIQYGASGVLRCKLPKWEGLPT